MSGSNNSTVNVGPTAELSNVRYGDAIYQSPSKNLSPRQFHAFMPKVVSPSVDNGWLGPLGQYGDQPNATIYGYGVAPDNPQY